MKNLVLKELKLNVKWPVYIMSLMGGVMLAPTYPLIIAIAYSIFQIFIYMQVVRENHSLEFSAVLPVKRADIVRSTIFVIVLLQMLTVFVSAIFAIIARFINSQENIVGLDANFTFFGVSFLCLAAFNAVFLPKFFKSGYKFGVPMLLGLLCFGIAYGVCETLAQAIPVLHNALDSYDTATLWARLTVLCVGVIIYVVSLLLTTKLSIKKFERANL